MNLLDLIFPKTCLECGQEGRYICDSCLAKVVKGRVGREATSIFKYQGVIRKAIIALKYKYSLEIAKELAEACTKELVSGYIPTNPVLVPIPMHWRRENVRGFNQSFEVGKLVARNMKWKFEPDLLIKKRSTNPQVGLRGQVRRSNLLGTFGVSPNVSTLRRSHIILFDDVYTTGSTLKEARNELKKAGMGKIWGLTIAR